MADMHILKNASMPLYFAIKHDPGLFRSLNNFSFSLLKGWGQTERVNSIDANAGNKHLEAWLLARFGQKSTEKWSIVRFELGAKFRQIPSRKSSKQSGHRFQG